MPACPDHTTLTTVSDICTDNCNHWRVALLVCNLSLQACLWMWMIRLPRCKNNRVTYRVRSSIVTHTEIKDRGLLNTSNRSHGHILLNGYNATVVRKSRTWGKESEIIKLKMWSFRMDINQLNMHVYSFNLYLNKLCPLIDLLGNDLLQLGSCIRLLKFKHVWPSRISPSF